MHGICAVLNTLPASFCLKQIPSHYARVAGILSVVIMFFTSFCCVSHDAVVHHILLMPISTHFRPSLRTFGLHYELSSSHTDVELGLSFTLSYCPSYYQSLSLRILQLLFAIVHAIHLPMSIHFTS